MKTMLAVLLAVVAGVMMVSVGSSQFAGKGHPVWALALDMAGGLVCGVAAMAGRRLS
jgi:hypothetical protein